MADAPRRTELPEKINFPAEETRILELDAFNKSLELSEGKPEVGSPARTNGGAH